MSVKVPYETVEYQSHHHCQCDYCNSRRVLNAKKYGVSKTVADLQNIGIKNNCCCSCHQVLASRMLRDGSGAAPSFELDDPEHHVNQTALNAANGRTGIPGGDRYTIGTNTSRGTRSGKSLEASKKTQEEMEKDALEDLDRLERLLVLEHKARVKATLDTKDAQIQMESGKPLRPIPFDASAEQQQTAPRQTPSSQHEDAQPLPPDGSNGSRTPLPLSSAHSPAPDRTIGTKEATGKDGTFGKSTRNVFYGPRPEGAGVVWRKIKPSMPEDMSTGVGGIGNMDNRDLWKSRLVKGTIVKKEVGSTAASKGPEATANTTAVAQEKSLSPGAQAAIQQQREQQTTVTGENAPNSTVQEEAKN